MRTLSARYCAPPYVSSRCCTVLKHVRVVAVVGADAEGEWEWLKWLPHHQHPIAIESVGSARMVYRSLSEAEVAILSPDAGQLPHVALILDGGAVTGAERLWTSGGISGVTALVAGSARDAITDRTMVYA